MAVDRKAYRGLLRLCFGGAVVFFGACATLAAEPGDCIPPKERLITARPTVVPLDPAGRPINLKYKPLLLPSTASLRGIELSGSAKLYERARDRYYMSDGCVLINTIEPTVIETCRVAIHAKANSSMVVHTEDDITRVMNISDRHRSSVRVVLGKNFIDLSPGQEIGIIAGGKKDPRQLVTGDVLGYRQLQVVPVGDGLKLVLWEFSLNDAIKQCYIFRQLRESPDSADHKLLKEIIKTAAAVDTMYKKSRAEYIHGPQNSDKQKSTNSSKLAERSN